MVLSRPVLSVGLVFTGYPGGETVIPLDLYRPPDPKLHPLRLKTSVFQHRVFTSIPTHATECGP